MGQLAAFLQQEFQRHCPPGWQAQNEAPLLADEWCQVLGYAPQMTNNLGIRLVWISGAPDIQCPFVL